MGNHEFCTECGESDFHLDSPCDPQKKAAYQAQRHAFYDAHMKRIRYAELCLNAAGIPFTTERVFPTDPHLLRITVNVHQMTPSEQPHLTPQATLNAIRNVVKNRGKWEAVSAVIRKVELILDGK